MKLRLMAWIAGSAMSLFAAGSVSAADCGCDIPCDACPAEEACCDCGCSESHRGCRLTDSLHKFQDRLKTICDFKWCHWKLGSSCDSLCDDACDAAMMDDMMMMSAPTVTHHGPVHSHSHAMPHSQVLPEAHRSPTGIDSISPPVHSHEMEMDSDLFESLPDPFIDDDVQLNTQRSVRPSSHDEVVLQPAPRRPLSRGYESSRRLIKSAR